MSLLSRIVVAAAVLAACAWADETDGKGGSADPLSEAPAPLAEAIRNYAAESGRWAYTQHQVVRDGKGRVDRNEVARFDPSLHYDEQWTLVELNGKPATERQNKKYRRDRAKKAKNRSALGELLELGSSVVAREDGNDIVYEVPLREHPDTRLPPEKFQVFVTVDCAAGQLRLIEVNLRESWRIAGVVKMKDAAIRIEFARVSEEHGAVASALSAGGTGSLFFVTLATRTEAKRTDFKRVTPYDERFQVQIGPVKALDF